MSAASTPYNYLLKTRMRAIVVLGIFLMTVGARLWLLRQYGSPVPFMDAWNGELSTVIKPWIENKFTFGDLFLSHNEHRIILTRLTTLVLFVFNHQWDVQLEAAFNTLLSGLTVVFLSCLFSRWLPRRLEIPSYVVMLLYGVLPFAWENTLFGFASQFYYLLIFSLLAMWGLGFHPSCSRSWWLGLCSAILGCISLGSGFVALISVVAILFLRLLSERRMPVRGEWLTASLAVFVSAISLATKVDVPQHAVLKASSIGAFAIALGKCMAWPWTNHVLAPVLLYLPLAGLLLRYVLKSEKNMNTRRATELLLILGIWVLVQSIAMAYARGAGGSAPVSRYTDIVAIGLIVNLLVVLLWGLSSAFERAFSPWKSVITAVWIGYASFGVGKQTLLDFEMNLPDRRKVLQVGEEAVKQYVAINDVETLKGKTYPAIPYPDAEFLVDILSVPEVRSVLPAGIRPMLGFVNSAARSTGLSASNSSADTFVENGAPFEIMAKRRGIDSQVFGSYSTREGPAAQGVWSGELNRQPRLPYLQMQTTGYLGGKNLLLQARNRAKETILTLEPCNIAMSQWKPILFPAEGVSEIRASDHSATLWFAFGDLYEMGVLSYWSAWLIELSPEIFLFGLSLMLGVIIISMCRQRTAYKTNCFGEQIPPNS